MLITFNLDNQIMYPLHHVSDYISGSGPHCFRTQKDCLNQRERERGPTHKLFSLQISNFEKNNICHFLTHLWSAFICLPIAIIRSAKAESVAVSWIPHVLVL